MSIVSAEISKAFAQNDGSTQVVERFVDHLGNVYEQFRWYAVGDDFNVALSIHAAELEEKLAAPQNVGEE